MCVPCEAYEPPRLLLGDRGGFALLGGHLSFAGVQRWLFASSRQKGARVKPPAGQLSGLAGAGAAAPRSFRCVVTLRPTVERVRACWDERLAGRGAPSTTMICPSDDPVATNRLPSWSMIETQQTPALLAAALTAGFLRTWTAAISALEGCPEGLSRGDRRPGCLV